MLEFICSTCGKRVQGDDSLAGMRVSCPVCMAAMTAPQPPQAVLSPSTAIATPEHASMAKIAIQPTVSDGSFCEGTPSAPSGPTLPLRDAAPHVIQRAVPYLIIAAVCMVVIGLTVPAVQKVREADARTQSTNNLKQIGLAFHTFHDANKRLPYNGTPTLYVRDGRTYGGPAASSDFTTGSWAFMITSYLDQGPVFSELNTDVGFAAYLCPGRGRPSSCTGAGGPGAWTDYAINPFLNDPNGLPNAPDANRTLVGVTDGTSNTIFVGQGQMNPKDYRSTDVTAGFTDIIFKGGSPGLCRANPTPINSRDSCDPPSAPGNWGGPFSQGCLMCMGDATVRMFPYSVTGGNIVNGVNHVAGVGGYAAEPAEDLAVDFGFGAFLTPHGGEVVTMPSS